MVMVWIVVACGASSGPGASSGSSLTTAEAHDFDCGAYESSAEFEGLNPETRKHLRAMCDIEVDFEHYASERRGCKSDADCVALDASCPFGCTVPVAAKEKAAVQAKYEELRARFHAEGSACDYQCGSAASVTCQDGSCALVEP
jgi:hypothetical protein